MSKDYCGFPYDSLRNPFLQLDYLTTAGPRLVGLYLAGESDNLLAVIPDLVSETPFGDFRFLGGHRLWHAPEAHPRTYIPDDHGLTVEVQGSVIGLQGALEVSTGIQKSMHIELKPDAPVVVIQHTLTNHGPWPVELAAWALTQLPLGGTAILPQTTDTYDRTGLLPNRKFVLWPYTSWSDPRVALDDQYIFIEGIPRLPPFKVGYANTRGWIGYLRNGILLCKRTSPHHHGPYPDFGANAECYCNDRFLELETLSPLTRLEPGESVQHLETWEIYHLDDRLPSRESLIQAVERLNLG